MRRYALWGFLCFIAFVSSVASIQAQTFTVSGKITAPPAVTGTPIPGVNVVITLNGNSQLMTTTDGSGNFAFANIAAGTNYDVTPTKAGFVFNPESQGGSNIQADRTLFFTGTTTTTGSIQFNAATTSIAEGTDAVNVTVTRTGDSSTQASIDYATSDAAGANSCATANGNASSRCDYLTTLGNLTFAAGETSKVISIPIIDDVYAEGNETFTITLSNAVGATLGGTTSEAITVTDNETVTGTSNPIDQAGFFVKQHYFDFLNRQPDAGGLNFWTNEITGCGSNAQCIEVKRINVSAAFFLSIEFQETGYLVYRVFKTGLGNVSGTPVPVRFIPFLRDTQRIGQGVQVGVGNWQAQLEANKQAYALAFVQRPEFLIAFPNTMTADEIVTKMDQNAGLVLSPTEKANLVATLGTTPSDITKRASVLRSVAEDADLKSGEQNKAFVLMQYFGYMRRNPDDAPDSDFSGYNFWLGKLNSFNGNFVNAEMVKAFISSDEYRHRFGP